MQNKLLTGKYNLEKQKQHESPQIKIKGLNFHHSLRLGEPLFFVFSFSSKNEKSTEAVKNNSNLKFRSNDS